MAEFKKVTTGKVNWEALRGDLMQLDKETLCDLVSTWIQNDQARQDYWVSFVEKECGVSTTERLDNEVYKRCGKLQAKRLKELFRLGGDIQSAAFLMKHLSYQWSPSGFEWEIDYIDDKCMRFHVSVCPMATYRRAHNQELYHCKSISPDLYNYAIKVLNPKLNAVCTHAHPDAPIEGVNCAWEITLED